MIKWVFIVLISIGLIFSGAAIAEDNDIRVYRGSDPFKKTNKVRKELSDAGKNLAMTYESADKRMDARKYFFRKFIKLSDLTKLEKSLLLKFGASIDRENGEYSEAAKKLLIIINDGELPQSDMRDIYYSTFEMAYGAGRYNLAAKAIAEAGKLHQNFMPWDQAAIAEILIRSGAHEKALHRLNNAISILKKRNCLIEDHWGKAYTALTNNNISFLQDLKSDPKPFFFNPTPEVKPEPIKLVNAIYPRKLAIRGYQGNVIVHLIVNGEGKPVCTFLDKSTLMNGDFYWAAHDAVMKFKYKKAPDNQINNWRYGISYKFIFELTGR